MISTPQTMTEIVARAICKVEFCDPKIYGDEICCQFAPASIRREGGENLEACGWEGFFDTAKASIDAHTAALSEQGMVIVPREPTDAMVDHATDNKDFKLLATAFWQAMIDTALEETK